VKSLYILIGAEGFIYYGEVSLNKKVKLKKSAKYTRTSEYMQ